MTAKNRAAAPVINWAREQGCEVTLGRSGHYRVTYRGRFVGTVAYSPSDPRAMRNAQSFIRRNLRAI